jgi:hypothetical protein
MSLSDVNNQLPGYSSVSEKTQTHEFKSLMNSTMIIESLLKQLKAC